MWDLTNIIAQNKTRANKADEADESDGLVFEWYYHPDPKGLLTFCQRHEFEISLGPYEE
jgi:hypothetical protein